MPVNRKDEQYYTIREVAEIKGITRQSVLEGCKRGQYSGAYKTVPDAVNRQGVWLIPKAVIDTPIMTQEVVTVNKQITPTELKNMIEQVVEKTVNERMSQFEQRLENHDKVLMETIRIVQSKNEKEKKPFWKKWFID